MTKGFSSTQVTEAVASIQNRSKELGTDKISMEEIDAEIKAVRKIGARFVSRNVDTTSPAIESRLETD